MGSAALGGLWIPWTFSSAGALSLRRVEEEIVWGGEGEL